MALMPTAKEKDHSSLIRPCYFFQFRVCSRAKSTLVVRRAVRIWRVLRLNFRADIRGLSLIVPRIATLEGYNE